MARSKVAAQDVTLDDIESIEDLDDFDFEDLEDGPQPNDPEAELDDDLDLSAFDDDEPTAEEPEDEAEDEPEPKPKRGRPKGSKNKPKAEAAAEEPGIELPAEPVRGADAALTSMVAQLSTRVQALEAQLASAAKAFLNGGGESTLTLTPPVPTASSAGDVVITTTEGEPSRKTQSQKPTGAAASKRWEVPEGYVDIEEIAEQAGKTKGAVYMWLRNQGIGKNKRYDRYVFTEKNADKIVAQLKKVRRGRKPAGAR